MGSAKKIQSLLLREWYKSRYVMRASIVLILGTWALFHGIGMYTLRPLMMHIIDLSFLCMCPFLVASIVSDWLHAEKQPWIVWQGELRYGYLTRQLIPMFVAFILIVIVLATGVLVIYPDLAEWKGTQG
jgi:hypothetical protein